MGFLAPAEAIIAAALAQAMAPPAPPDITRWCEQNIVFDERSPMPGPFNIERFEFLREIHRVLSPEHPSREVTVRGSAQWGKTVSVIQPTLGAWFAYAALDALVVHPTTSAATEWVDNKWLPMRRQAADLRRVFGDGRGINKDNTFNQETLLRNGSLKVASAGSPADLTGTSRRLVIMDDLAKYEMTVMGDPEALAVSRASGFEDAKILRVSTAGIKSTCRISRAYARSTQQLFHVPCPHCAVFAPLTWENFLSNIDPANLHAAHFSCDSCGCVIQHGDKEKIVGQGHWVAQNPRGDHPGFHLWRGRGLPGPRPPGHPHPMPLPGLAISTDPSPAIQWRWPASFPPTSATRTTSIRWQSSGRMARSTALIRCWPACRDRSSPGLPIRRC